MIKLTAKVFCIGLIILAPGVSAADDGAETYKMVCSGCHETGIDGAPKLEDKAAWKHRIKPGMDALYASSMDGKCRFFVQDLRKDLSDEAIKAAVDYMISQVR